MNDYFDKIYIINLPERSDRRREMNAELKKIGWSLKEGSIEYFPAIRPETAEPFPSIGSKGCFLSHLQALKEARVTKAKRILMIEDDLAFSPQLKSFQDDIVEKLEKSQWGLAYLGHRIDTPSSKSKVYLTPYTDKIHTTHFFAVNGLILDRLIDFLETLISRPAGHPDGGPMHYDGALSTFRRQNPDIVTLIANPNLGWQRPSRSDIYANKWFDRAPVVKQLVEMTRRLKSRIPAETA